MRPTDSHLEGIYQLQIGGWCDVIEPAHFAPISLGHVSGSLLHVYANIHHPVFDRLFYIDSVEEMTCNAFESFLWPCHEPKLLRQEVGVRRWVVETTIACEIRVTKNVHDVPYAHTV